MDKKVSQIYEPKRTQKSANLSHVEQAVGNAFLEIMSHLQGQNKRIASFIVLDKVIQIATKKLQCILIYFAYRSHKVLLTPLYKRLINELEKKLKKTVLIVSARNIQSRWIKANKTQKRPFSRTLTAVYAAFLDELLLPGIITGHRTRVRLDGTQFIKLTLDKSEEHFLEERVQAIKLVYKKLTNRHIEIDFAKDPVYYTLKQGEKTK